MSVVPFVNSPDSVATFSLWDQLHLGGITWPGLWAIGVKKKRSLDIVKIRRRDGTMTLDNGYFGAELDAVGRIWTFDQWTKLQAILPNFDPQRRGGGRSPLGIYHPGAALLGCNQVYIQELGIPAPGSPRSSVIFNIGMVQWCADLKLFVQDFAGTQRAGDSIDLPQVPSADTGSKL